MPETLLDRILDQLPERLGVEVDVIEEWSEEREGTIINVLVNAAAALYLGEDQQALEDWGWKPVVSADSARSLVNAGFHINAALVCSDKDQAFSRVNYAINKLYEAQAELEGGGATEVKIRPLM